MLDGDSLLKSLKCVEFEKDVRLSLGIAGGLIAKEPEMCRVSKDRPLLIIPHRLVTDTLERVSVLTQLSLRPPVSWSELLLEIVRSVCHA